MGASLSSLDELFILAEAAPFLEKVTESLHRREHFGNKLSHEWLKRGYIPKLLQDAGVQIDREMNGYDPSAPAPGPETARVNAEYEAVDQKRVRSVLQNAYAALEQSRMKDEEKKEMGDSLKEIMKELQIPLAPPASRPSKVRQMKPTAI